MFRDNGCKGHILERIWNVSNCTFFVAVSLEQWQTTSSDVSIGSVCQLDRNSDRERERERERERDRDEQREILIQINTYTVYKEKDREMEKNVQ